MWGTKQRKRTRPIYSKQKLKDAIVKNTLKTETHKTQDS